MKLKKVKQKLSLNKTTISNLERKAMQGLRGGVEKTTLYWCVSRNYCSEAPVICETRLFCSTPYCETDPIICE